MTFLGTVAFGGSAWAVYAAPPLALADFWERARVVNDDYLSVPPEFRLVAVTDEPAPERLPPDLSPSLH